MAAGELATLGARASTAMVFIWFSLNISALAAEWFMLLDTLSHANINLFASKTGILHEN